MIDDQIKRLRDSLVSHGIILRPPLSAKEIERFENRHGISLPGGYRRFISEVGDGGAGPPQSGLFPLLESRSVRDPHDRWNELPEVALPFPLLARWIWENEDDTAPDWLKRRLSLNFGSIRIGDDGCGQFWHLIVTGSERGNVWMLDGEGAVPAENRPFLSWYEAWLEASPMSHP